VAVGPGRLDDNGKRVPLDVVAGDRILYAKYTGTEVKLDNEEYIVLNEKDILAKLVV
jgi:chaperonin GroES